MEARDRQHQELKHQEEKRQSEKEDLQRKVRMSEESSERGHGEARFMKEMAEDFRGRLDGAVTKMRFCSSVPACSKTVWAMTDTRKVVLPVPGGPCTKDKVPVGDFKKFSAARDCVAFNNGNRKDPFLFRFLSVFRDRF